VTKDNQKKMPKQTICGCWIHWLFKNNIFIAYFFSCTLQGLEYWAQRSWLNKRVREQEVRCGNLKYYNSPNIFHRFCS